MFKYWFKTVIAAGIATIFGEDMDHQHIMPSISLVHLQESSENY